MIPRSRIRLRLALPALALASLLAGCGASLEPGAHPTANPTQPASAKSSPAATPTACVTPSAVASYHLAGATTLSGNLQIKDLKVGTGAAAKAGSTVSVTYTGSLPNGTVFDSSAKHGGKPISFQLQAGKVIQGWVEGIPGMRVGGERELVIPPALAYGCTSPSSAIPADSTLIFTVNLSSVG